MMEQFAVVLFLFGRSPLKFVDILLRVLKRLC